jgi:DNA-binding NarL/FixJ family response regulator
MFNDQLAKLEKAKADLQQLESKISAERAAALAKLPSDFGFASLELFIAALKDAAKNGGKLKGKASRGAKSGAAKAPKAAATKAVKVGKRAKITDETRAQVKVLSEQGKTGEEIAKALGISAPSVQNVKKALGLVKSRTKTAPAAPAAAAQSVADVAPAL